MSEPWTGHARRQPGHAERLAAARSAQGERCVWCGRTFGPLVAATTDHLVPRVRGGPSWPENEVASCRRCNGQRGHLGVADWLECCQARGWPSDTAVLMSSLIALQEAIDHRGGARRARPHLRSQLRRLRPVVPAKAGRLRA